MVNQDVLLLPLLRLMEAFSNEARFGRSVANLAGGSSSIVEELLITIIDSCIRLEHFFGRCRDIAQIYQNII